MLTITGLQEAQRANLRHIASVKPDGALGDAVKEGTLAAQRYMVSITHVDTGSLRAAELVRLSGLRGEIYIDPSAVNPRGGSPAEYGPAENARGGEHAFMERTATEGLGEIQRIASEAYRRGLQR